MAHEERQLPAVKGPVVFRARAERREVSPWKGIGKYLAIGSCVVLAQSAGLLLLSGMMKRRRRNNELMRHFMQRAIQVREEEHLHLARELHDNIGQRLSLLSMRLASLRNLHPLGDGNETELADSVQELDAVISEIHNLSHSMHSSRLEHLGLEDALSEVCSEVSKRYPVHVDFQVSGEFVRLDPRVSLCFYRVAQEALNNVVRHSRSAQAQVLLVRSSERLAMKVVDFGVGFDRKTVPFGLGLASIEERMLSIRGSIFIESGPGKGTVIRVEAPTYPFVSGDLQVATSGDGHMARNAPQFT
jgi:signal transduction histidine kinase